MLVSGAGKASVRCAPSACLLVLRVCRGVGCVAGVFFFSSRRRHTRLQGDWSSDVCSSDLASWRRRGTPSSSPRPSGGTRARSEERRVGKSVDLGGRRIIKKKKNRHSGDPNTLRTKKTHQCQIKRPTCNSHVAVQTSGATRD